MKGPIILIASSVRQKPEILAEFLKSLQNLDNIGFEIKYCFIDDNTNPVASEMLHSFAPDQSHIILTKAEGEYDCTPQTHHWTHKQMDRVARQKDEILKYSASNRFHTFLVDSDLVLHPWTLQQLWFSDRDVISEIFWTKWKPGEPPLPQVWVEGQYTLFWREPGEILANEEIGFRMYNFFSVLKKPGIYEVGGLGACTLIRNNAIKKGLCFKRIPNLDLTGEDRHFSIRASVLGIHLYVDTHLPAYHIYRPDDLNNLPVYKEKCRLSVTESLKNKIHPSRLEPQSSLQELRTVKNERKLTLVMLVRNEADRYLPIMLQQIVPIIDEAVIVDDASTDNTPELYKDILTKAAKPFRIVQNTKTGFDDEVNLRKQAWDLAVADNPDWMLFLDADEIFEEKAETELRLLLDDPRWDFYAFRLYDFWDASHYRDDPNWQAHNFYRPFLVRYQFNFDYQWCNQPLHCGRLPVNINALPGTISKLRIKHLGWSSPEDRKRKYDFYMTRDPGGNYGSLKQYRSILDPDPNLVEFE